ncbi:DUF3489 domain-containing protein [Pararhodobacter zhoushanensis]|uniref:DUF3489 domain-containing protein n=1 Tax=Pararhodobacter zhoushanensis TaxID=2479545 RepID=UPI000F8ECDC5|nr:DUF3489 domain-containing protein [Pararhodobacter zhoushanensis]
MTKLTQTQTTILSRAAARPGALALPLPERLAGAAANMAVARMIELGWLEEVDADIRCREPLWRETGDGHGTTLIATEAGLAAIGIEPVVLKAVAGLRGAKSAQEREPTSTSIADAPKPAAIRTGTKQAQIIALLQRPEGAAIAEIAAETGWQAHSVRGAISGALKKKLGLPITSEKVEGRGTVYKLDDA